MDTETLPDLYTEYMPPEIVLNPHHPATDPYLKDIEQLKQEIVNQSACLRPKHVQIVKLAHKNKKTKEIAETVSVGMETVRRVLRQTEARCLLALLRHLTLALEGPITAQRRHMLWRIAQRNEIEDPRVAISALAELNKVEHQDRQLERGLSGNVNGQLEIVIHNHLGRGPLDE